MEHTTKKTDEHMLNIWFFVGFLLALYGIIITLAGVFYIFKPHTEVQFYELNPSLWWGLIMLISGGIFLFISRRNKSNGHKD